MAVVLEDIHNWRLFLYFLFFPNAFSKFILKSKGKFLCFSFSLLFLILHRCFPSYNHYIILKLPQILNKLHNSFHILHYAINILRHSIHSFQLINHLSELFINPNLFFLYIVNLIVVMPFVILCTYFAKHFLFLALTNLMRELEAFFIRLLFKHEKEFLA